MFVSHNLLEHKLSIMRRLQQHKVNNIATDTAAGEAEEHHVKKACCSNSFPLLVFCSANTQTLQLRGCTLQAVCALNDTGPL